MNAKRSNAPVIVFDASSSNRNVCRLRKAVVRANEEYVPPYGTGGTPTPTTFFFLIGKVGDIIGVKPAEEHIFTIFAMPVGNYFKGGLSPTNSWIQDEYDRAAPMEQER